MAEKKDKLLTDKERLEILLTRQESVNPDAMLDDIEVATLLKCSPQQLQIGRKSEGKVLRQRGGKTEVFYKDLPPHHVLFGRLIRYRYGDLMQWLHREQKEDAA